MSREVGLVSLSANIEAQAAAPLDARMKVGLFADLTLTDTWLALDGSSYAYRGMITAVADDPDEDLNGIYVLKNLPLTEAANWEKSSAGTEFDPSLFYTKAEMDALLLDKQNTLVAGDNITIDAETNTISAAQVEVLQTLGDSTTATISQAAITENIAVKVGEGTNSSIQGTNTVATGNSSHAEGIGTIAAQAGQHVQGQYNVEDTEGTYVDIVGWGTDADNRANIETTDKAGNKWLAGNITIGGTPTADDHVATVAVVTNRFNTIIDTLNNREYFRGYFATTLEIEEIPQPTEGSYAYNGETGTVWAYNVDTWEDTLQAVPDKTIPKSDITPLMNGVAAVGGSETYAAGDHVHPSDTTKADATTVEAIDTRVTEVEADIAALPATFVSSVNTLVGDAVLTGNNILTQDKVAEGEEPTFTKTVSQAIIDNDDKVEAHIADVDNPHEVTAEQVGLGLVDNTADADKPVSTAVQTALDSKQNTLTAGNNINITAEGVISSSAVVEEFNYTNADETTEKFGGIEVGSTFADGILLSDLLNLAMYPDKFPEFTEPSLTLTSSVTIAEVGATVNGNLTAEFNRGTIDPAYETSGFRSGTPRSYVINGTTRETTELLATSPLSVNSLVEEDISYLATCNYNAGEQPLSLKGVAYSTPYPGGEIQASYVVNVVFPYFATTNTAGVLDKQSLAKLNGEAFVEVNLVTEGDAAKQAISYPSSWGDCTGIEFYNTFSRNWEWLSGSDTRSLSTFTRTVEVRTVNTVEQEYVTYTNSSHKIGERSLRFYF